MIRSINELIKEKLNAAAEARMALAMAIKKGDTRVARRCKCSHNTYLREIRILWEMKALMR